MAAVMTGVEETEAEPEITQHRKRRQASVRGDD
jgi:hypothetical protein